ncbi:MAG TPA: hypothetical protein EYH22_03560 [Candidatus Nanopusillus sp.]|nr:hypothetical protein [Candidatus Nanopusillus sp.]
MSVRAQAIQTIVLIILALIVLIAGIVIINKISSSAGRGISELENIKKSTAGDILGKCALLSSQEIFEKCKKVCEDACCSYKDYKLTDGKLLCICYCHDGAIRYNRKIWVDC